MLLKSSLFFYFELWFSAVLVFFFFFPLLGFIGFFESVVRCILFVWGMCQSSYLRYWFCHSHYLLSWIYSYTYMGLNNLFCVLELTSDTYPRPLPYFCLCFILDIFFWYHVISQIFTSSVSHLLSKPSIYSFLIILLLVIFVSRIIWSFDQISLTFLISHPSFQFSATILSLTIIMCTVLSYFEVFFW